VLPTTRRMLWLTPIAVTPQFSGNGIGSCSTLISDPASAKPARSSIRTAAAGRYLTSESMRNIGRYIAMTMTPTMQPTRIIINGSTIDVSDWIAASTSSS
jgi:hypothetical protein